MKKSNLILIVVTVLCCTAILCAAIIVANRSPKTEVQPEPTEQEDTSKEEDGSEVVAGEDRTFGEIVDERANGTDTSSSPIVVPRSDLSQYDDSVREETVKTDDEASGDLITTFEVSAVPAGYVMSETMEYYENQFNIADNSAELVYSMERLIEQAGFSTEYVMVRCPDAYKIECDFSWKIGYGDKVYTIILKDNKLSMYDQGIDFDDTVRII